VDIKAEVNIEDTSLFFVGAQNNNMCKLGKLMLILTLLTVDYQLSKAESAVATADHVRTIVCGDQPCVLDFRRLCLDVIDLYSMRGTCCSLSDLENDMGCQLTVAGEGGYCAFRMKHDERMETCTGNDAQGCLGREVLFKTDTKEPCPEFMYDIHRKAAPAPTTSFTIGPSGPGLSSWSDSQLPKTKLQIPSKNNGTVTHSLVNENGLTIVEVVCSLPSLIINELQRLLF
jgi:hypothetical protein